MTENRQLIRSFVDIRAADLPLVGGKGANLGELTHLGFPVPPGFCLTTKAFQHFIEACPQAEDLYALLDTVTAHDVETARKVGQHVRQSLLGVPMPQHVGEAIGQAWRELGQDQAYAVRSSATAEDLPGASFAGQQDSYLNIRGEASLVDAVRRCWTSLFTDRATLYRVQNGFTHRQVQLSVVVQQMVMAEMSGILFTADPLTGHRHTVAIDASFGLGEALVSGLVSPDAYRVDKRNRTIIDRQIADKEMAIVPETDGGTREERLPEAQRSQTVLTDTQILALADMGSRVEAHYHAPQDIEWVIVAGRIYLLQARPITALYPIDGLQSPDDDVRIYFSMGHQQNMTNAMSPLGLSGLQNLIPVGRTQAEIENTFLRANGGRLFMDLSSGLRHPILRRILFNALAQFDSLAPESLRMAMAGPEFQRPHALSFSVPLLRGMVRTVFRILSALWRQDLTGLAATVDNRVDRHIQEVRTRLDGAQAGEAQIQAVVGVLQSAYLVVLQWVPQFAASVIAQRLLVRLGRNWAEPTDLEAYLLGLPGNVVTEMNLAVGDLADIARRSPQVSALFGRLANDSQAWLAEATQLEEGGPFLRAWDDFLARYGSRGSAEIDIKTLHWYEEPLPLLKVIANHLQQEAGSHRAQQQSLIQARESAVSRLISKAGQGLLGGLRARLARRLIHVSQEGSVLREHHKFMVVQILRIIKEDVEKTATLLTDAQKLTWPDDVWYLSYSELLALCRGDALDAVERIPSRRAELLRFKELTPPLVITSDGETPVVRNRVADAPPGALVGNSVSAGVVEGPVRVIHDPQTETLNPGEILVAPFTDPGWTPLFINAGGLIMEIGGIMTHGSVVAREYGIPAIVGVREATKRLQTGQRVRMDGNRGIIELLETPGPAKE